MPTPPPPEEFDLELEAKPAAERERAALAQLIEVERAIAALEGRDVENAEHLLHTRVDIEKRRAALQDIIVKSREEMVRRKRLLPIKILAVILAVGVAGAISVPIAKVAKQQVEARMAASDNAQAAAKPFEELFNVQRSVTNDTSFSFEAPRGKCYIVVGATTDGAAHVRVERKVGTREADGSVGFCSCDGNEATVTLSGKDPLAAVVLEAEATIIGGADVLGSMPGHPAVTFPEPVDRACAELSFDEWAPGHKAIDPPPAAEQLSDDGKALVGQGFTAHGRAIDGVPFVLPSPAGDSCFVAATKDRARIALRIQGAERPIDARNGTLGFCTKNTVSVWRESPGDLVLFKISRERVGGLLGLREAAARAGMSIGVWSAPDELAEDAKITLAASGVAPAIGGAETKRGATVAISKGPKSMLASSDFGKEVACQPDLLIGAGQALCLEGRPGAFAPASKPEGMVVGLTPLWVAAPDKPDPVALTRALDLLTFARRMTAEGYHLTSLVGATFAPGGLDVTGQSGEKEFVALVTSSAPPYLHTLSDGKPWTLTEPRPTPFTPGKSTRVIATPRFLGRATREFVVFRR